MSKVCNKVGTGVHEIMMSENLKRRLEAMRGTVHAEHGRGLASPSRHSNAREVVVAGIEQFC